MKLRSTRHKGLLRFIEDGDLRGLRPDLVRRIRSILAAIELASSMEQLEGPPGWRVHQLSGDRQGTWSISASGNWRITFRVLDGEIVDLDLEDYH